jgi:hypothetical protein
MDIEVREKHGWAIEAEFIDICAKAKLNSRRSPSK